MAYLDNVTLYCTNLTPATEHKNPENCSTFKLVIDVYVVICLSAFGIFGNFLSILVLGREKRIRETAFLLQVIATADIVYLTTCLFFQSINTLTLCTTWLPAMKRFWPRMEPYIWPVASIAHTCTTWFVVLLTAERYIAICKPLTALMLERSRLRKLAFIVFVVALCYNLPRFFERSSRKVLTCDGDVTYYVERTRMRNDKYYIVIYKTTMYLLLRYFIPISLLAFFNAHLIRSIRRSSQLQRSGSTRSRCSQSTCHKKFERKRFTFILIAAVVIVSVLCGLPDLFLRLWMSFTKIMKRENSIPGGILRFNIISNLFLTINSSINFLIYCVLGKKFRENLLLMMCRSRRQDPPFQAFRLRRIEIERRLMTSPDTVRQSPMTSRNAGRQSVMTSYEYLARTPPTFHRRQEDLYG